MVSSVCKKSLWCSLSPWLRLPIILVANRYSMSVWSIPESSLSASSYEWPPSETSWVQVALSAGAGVGALSITVPHVHYTSETKSRQIRGVVRYLPAFHQGGDLSSPRTPSTLAPKGIPKPAPGAYPWASVSSGLWGISSCRNLPAILIASQRPP